MYKAVQNALPNFGFIEMGYAMMAQQMIKSEEEIALIRDGAEICDAGAQAFVDAVEEGYMKIWEEASLLEHKKLIELISEGKFLDAANFLKDVHWSFEVQKEFVRKYYSFNEKNES
jgi:Xaa-Pro aminopeptidase